MGLFKKSILGDGQVIGEDKDLVEAITAEKGSLEKVSQRETELATARTAYEAAKREYLAAAAKAATSDDPVLKAERQAREEAREAVEFYEAALAGEQERLNETQRHRYDLAKQQNIKTVSRLAKKREDAAQKLAKTIEQYAIDVLSFYEASGALATADPTPGRDLSKNVLTTKGEIANAIEVELARINPVLPIEEDKKIKLPGQKIPPLGNPRTSTPLIEKVKASNAYVLKLVSNGPGGLL